MSQLAAQDEIVQPTVIDRAQRYERAALEALLVRCLGPVYRLSYSLIGDPAAAEDLTRHSLMRGLNGLATFEGDDEDFEAAALRAAVAAAYPRRPRDPGLRQSLAQLNASEYELVALRVLAGLTTEQVARTLNGRQVMLRAQLLSALRALTGDGVHSLPFFGPGLEDFDSAVDEVVAGETPERAAPRVSEPVDVLARLRTVALLTRISTSEPAPAAESRLRQDFLSSAAERRVRWVERHQAAPKVPGMESRRYRRHSRGYFLLFGGLFVALLVGLTLAVGASIADPDSLLYPIKQMGEKVLIDANPDAVGRANTEVSLAATRLREAEDMASAGKPSLVVQSLRDRNALLESAAKDLRSASRHDAHWTSSRDQLLSTASTSLGEVERELTAGGDAATAAQVRQLDAAWGRRVHAIEQALGAQPAPTSTAPPGG